MQQFFQFIILTFIHSSTCFGSPQAHHQELKSCSSSLWFYLRIVVIAVLLFVFGSLMGNRSVLAHHQQSKLFYLFCLLCWLCANTLRFPITDPTTTNSTATTTLQR